MSAHNLLKEALQAYHDIPDPGNGLVVAADRELGICELVSGSSAQTRTLSNPTRAGNQMILRMKTDGGGDITVTAEHGLNVAGNTTAVFADAGDQLLLVSVSHTTGYRWEILVNTGSVALS